MNQNLVCLSRIQSVVGKLFKFNENKIPFVNQLTNFPPLVLWLSNQTIEIGVNICFGFKLVLVGSLQILDYEASLSMA